MALILITKRYENVKRALVCTDAPPNLIKVLYSVDPAKSLFDPKEYQNFESNINILHLILMDITGKYLSKRICLRMF